MPIETVYALGESNITVSGGEQLSGISQGDGSHLMGHTITLNSNDWEAIDINDSEAFFQDSDNSQTLAGGQTFDGDSYSGGRRVEAEYRLVLQDPDGNTYEVLGFNINEPGVTSYSTVEGLAFVGGVGGFPPIGVPLTVISTHEGPSERYDDLATPPCFTTGCMIDTPDGPRAIETLKAGDLVVTRDHGAQPIKWIGVTHLPKAALEKNPKLRPVRIVSGALGQGLPSRDLTVSRQHRFVVASPIVERMFERDAVLSAAHSLCVLPGIDVVSDVTSVTYYHMLFERHEIVFAEGAPTESLYVGPETVRSIPKAALEEIYTLFPQLKSPEFAATSVLPMLDGKQTKPLMARHVKNGKPVLESYTIH